MALARAWDCPPLHAIEVCLQAVRAGLLQLRWDLLCPRCRVAKGWSGGLDRLRGQLLSVKSGLLRRGVLPARMVVYRAAMPSLPVGAGALRQWVLSGRAGVLLADKK